jgi:hypothetical protein
MADAAIMELDGARLRILPWAKLPKRHKRVAAVDRQEVQIGRHHTRSNLICHILSIGAAGSLGTGSRRGPKLQNAQVAGDWPFKQLNYWIVSGRKIRIMDLVWLQPH